MTSSGVLGQGRLLRGALHDGCTPPARPAGQGQVHLLDLRRPDEGSGSTPPWVCRHQWPLQDPQWAHGAARSPAFFVASALRLVPLAAGPVRDAVTLLGRGETVHVGCRLGKDRTGLVVLLLGKLFRVPDAALVQDYLRTAQEYAAATEWVIGYARARGEEVTAVAARLEVTEEVPVGILAGLPGGADLRALLGLDQKYVHAALHASTNA